MCEKAKQIITRAMVGKYYHDPKGRVAYCYKYEGGKLHFYFDGDLTGISEHLLVVQQYWKLTELKDFPGTLNPVLPEEFKYRWDIRRVDELQMVLEERSHRDLIFIQDLAKQYGLV